MFRHPKWLGLLCAACGVGIQFLCIVLLGILDGIVGFNYQPYVESTIVGRVLLVSFTSFFAGFFALALYRFLDGQRWALATLATATVFSGLKYPDDLRRQTHIWALVPAFLWLSIVNIIALSYHILHAVSFGSTIAIWVIWLAGTSLVNE